MPTTTDLHAKVCKQCKHYSMAQGLTHTIHRCMRDSVHRKDLVTGTIWEDGFYNCEDERAVDSTENDDPCGPEGKYFKQK